jgi:UDP-N-acetylglucosamine 2-epimerase
MQILTVVGARPQFVKAAPVSRALRRVVDEFLVHTGQHYDHAMSQAFFDELGIPEPDASLGIGSGSHGLQTGRMLERLEQVMLEQTPDVVIVYGDTNTTLAGALAAAKLQIPVAHVEAGVREHRRDMPEELNRIVTDHLSTFLLCPTPTAVENLRGEGIVSGVALVGDVMIDALDLIRPRLTVDRISHIGVSPPYFVTTLHRADTVDDPKRLQQAFDLLGALPGTVVFPMHPRTAKAAAAYDLRLSANVVAIPPLGFTDMMALVAGSEAVLTDSGGLPKEAMLLGSRCITLRSETGWVESVEAGLNAVVDLDIDLALEALRAPRPSPEAAKEIFPSGAAQRLVDYLIGKVGAALRDAGSANTHTEDA